MPHVADNTSRNTLRKHDRLKSSLEIEALYHENQFVVAYPLKCYYSFLETTEISCPIRVAFAVPKKTFKHAVDRNILKRRMREAYRQNYKKILEEFITQRNKQLKLFFIYVGKDMLNYGSIETSVHKILVKLS